MYYVIAERLTSTFLALNVFVEIAFYFMIASLFFVRRKNAKHRSASLDKQPIKIN
ncbi:MAG: hypothetical protein IH607_01685 [Firmicutes bacterium]|nr:hypothetical protein [Bacillota bacterium]